MPTPAPDLLADCRALVSTLVDDLRRLVDSDADAAAKVRDELDAARRAGRTSLSDTDWKEGRLAQVAVAWVLAGVFVRFCEDNGLIDGHRLAGTGHGLQEAKDRRSQHLREHPSHDDRHWLDEVIAFAAGHQGLDAVLGGHNPLRFLPLTADGARTFVGFWQEQAADGSLRRDFTDPVWDTRFLGDLYQDLSDHAKKTYALLQTPVFVEEFILDHTLTPALQEFGLPHTDVIDPTCGSGHFLLGAFDRLAQAWLDREPGTHRRVLAQRALDQVAGVDLNPFAVAVARFRLVVAAMRFEGVTRLHEVAEFRLHVATGDSLYHFQIDQQLPGTTGDPVHGYATEDLDDVLAILRKRYAVVVGNPPYITVKDPALNELYRKRFPVCRGKYSLGVPFTQQFVRLARTANDGAPAGHVGMITANSFMKREMGKKLIEEYLPRVDLTHVIDTSGAYIPGHGTPTVILFLRNQRPAKDSVQAVLGIRGEPSKPADPTKGVVWRSIVDLLPEGEAQNDYVTVTSLPRARLGSHPWSIGGGGASELKERLDGAGRLLGDAVEPIGFSAISGDDDVFLGWPLSAPGRVSGRTAFRALVTGEQVRDFEIRSASLALWPYDAELLYTGVAASTLVWPYRALLRASQMFQKSREERGLRWDEFAFLSRDRLRTPLSIAFAFVATHNHFVLDRGGKVFKQSAPVIKLPAGATEDDHLGLVGLLNSSTAQFWFRQTFFAKPSNGVKRGLEDEMWEQRLEYDGTKLSTFPLVCERTLNFGRALDKLAASAASSLPSAITERGAPTRSALDEARTRWQLLRAQMIAAQEELDWHVYSLYGLLDEDVTMPLDDVPPIELGQRAFEIVLARKVDAGDVETAWFARHRSTPITEIPSHWPDAYRRLVERRIELIESNPEIALIEQPQYKRRWAVTPWEDQEREALRTWLLDRMEAPQHWSGAPMMTTCASLAGRLRMDPDVVAVAHLLEPGADLTVLVTTLVQAEAVPYLAQERYTEQGLRKRAEWERVWDLQRAEDRGDQVGTIPVPPKYDKKDFRGVAWDHRGKLDVPKERFISYPGLGRPGDPSPVIGWAGWDHLQRAQALMSWYQTLEAGETERPARVLAGLCELLPWVQQWHDTAADDHAGTALAGVLEHELRSRSLTPDQLRSLPPATVARAPRNRKAPRP